MKKIFSAMLIGAVCLGVSTFTANANILKSSNVSKKDGWKYWIHKENNKAGAKLTWTKEGVSVNVPKCKFKIDYAIQVYKRTNSLVAGKKYKVSFNLESDKAAKITISYLLARTPYTRYTSQTVKIDPAKKQYECIITPKKIKDKYELPRSLRFFLGSIASGKVSLSNVKVEEVK